MRGHGVKELGPFGGAAGVGHVAGDEDEIDRDLGVDRFELGEQPLQPLIAARARSSALDAEAVALADGMDVGEMHDAPGFRVVGAAPRRR